VREHTYFVYIIASRSRTIYIGITRDLRRRVWEHQAGTFPGFTRTYRCHRLVWFETYFTVTRAIDREKQLKRWSRTKKINLIEQENELWEDLSEEWPQTAGPSTASRRRSDADFARDDKNI
jgi:putative endonuclease